MELTVIISDPGPFIFMEEPVAHRSVKIILTEEQVKSLNLRHVGTDRGYEVCEFISRCFIEPNPQAQEE